MEQLNFNMLFRWFVGLGLDDGVWDASAFCHNRDRLLEAEVSAQLLAGVIQHHKVGGLLSRDHFSVDGTLIEAWASMKSFRPKGEDDGDGGCGVFMARNARTRPMQAPLIRTPGFIARVMAGKSSCVTMR